MLKRIYQNKALMTFLRYFLTLIGLIYLSTYLDVKTWLDKALFFVAGVLFVRWVFVDYFTRKEEDEVLNND